MNNHQIQFDFTPGLTDRFDSLKKCVVHVAQSGAAKQGTIAAACDVSPSEFSKSLTGAEGRRMELDWLEHIIKETGDLSPIHYLMEKFLESPEAKQQRAAELLTQLLPMLQEAAETLKKGKRR